ncbi:MAG: lipid IV(A) 3-deoxy-D-manno-octulosonic acid transferase [Pseudomonadota bacterium]
MKSLARVIYTGLVYALLPYAWARLKWRARKEPGYGQDIGERFGRYARSTRKSSPLIWVHTVSVGETRAAEPLVRALQARYPDHRILLTHMTPTGRRAGQNIFGESVERCYLPYDFPGGVRLFLERFQPRLGVIFETEIWPNLLYACEARGVPLCLVNARLSEKSYRGYRWLGALSRPSIARFTAIAAQTPDDAQRLSTLDADDVIVAGNIKFDVTPRSDQVVLGRGWREMESRSVLLAASTREGEEALILDAYGQITAAPLLVIVPRHPQRFDEVALLLERRGLRYQRRSTGRVVNPLTEVLLGDTMGEMPAYYAGCDVAYIGGSLLPHGGQNFIEACAVGTPVLLGPHTYNFALAAEQAIASGAALRIQNASELAQAAQRLLSDEVAREEMSQRALEFSRAHRGATERILAMLEPLIEGSRLVPRNDAAKV